MCSKSPMGGLEPQTLGDSNNFPEQHDFVTAALEIKRKEQEQEEIMQTESLSPSRSHSYQLLLRDRRRHTSVLNLSVIHAPCNGVV